MTYYLGIDAGGSHCRSRLIDADGTVLGAGEAGPANARIGIDKLRAALIDVARQAVAAAGQPWRGAYLPFLISWMTSS